jgi:hypothetical protein
MHEPFDWRNQPEAAGPLTEPRSNTGVALDIQALQQGTIRLPQLDQDALAAGVYVPVSRTEPLLDAETRERERHQAALSRDEGREAMRSAFENAARHAGAHPLIARRTADELMKQVPAAAPGQDQVSAGDLIEEAVSDGHGLPAEAAEPVTEPAAEAEPEPPAATAAAVETEPAAVRPRTKPEKS